MLQTVDHFPFYGLNNGAAVRRTPHPDLLPFKGRRNMNAMPIPVCASKTRKPPRVDGKAFWWGRLPERTGRRSVQRVDVTAETALVPGGLVRVNDALVGHAVHNRHGGVHRLLCLRLVTTGDRMLDAL